MKVRGLIIVAILSLGFISGCYNDSMGVRDDDSGSWWGGRPKKNNAADEQFMTDDEPMSDNRPGMYDPVDQPTGADYYSPNEDGVYSSGGSSKHASRSTNNYSTDADASSSSAPAEVPFDDSRKEKSPPENVGAY